MTTHRNRLGRRLLALVASGALAAGLVAVTAPAATAAPTTTTAESSRITGATLNWGLNGEQGGGAFFGGCNFLSAGTAGDTGSSRLWTEADGFYKTVDGNVTVTKPDAAGEQGQPTWATKCQTPQGTAVTASSTTSLSHNQVNISGGTGTVNAETGAATIQWTGSFTSVFYGGLTYWTATNPKLVVDASGNGTLTATGSGYAASMEDTSKWEAITPRTITLAKLTDVDVDADGFTATPAYLGVETSVASGGTEQTRTGATWGAFPQDFVDFQQVTGQSSYWYSSGGSRDAAKPATPLTLGGYTITDTTVTVSETVVAPGETPTVTVTGTGFAPSAATGARPPFMNQPGGAYIAFAKVADTWEPSKGAASSTRGVVSSNTDTTKWAVPSAQSALVGGSYAELKADGTFTTTLKIDRKVLDDTSAIANNDALTKYGIITYPGSGAVAPSYETFTPITFEVPKAESAPVITANPTSYFGRAHQVTVTVPTANDVVPTGSVTLTGAGTQTKSLSGGKATFTLSRTLSVGAKTLKVAYAGDARYLDLSATKAFTVVKAPVVTSSRTTLKPTTTKTGKAVITVKSKIAGAPTPSGTIRVFYSRSGHATRNVAKALSGGSATVTVPKLPKGTWKVSVRYSGSSGSLNTPIQYKGSWTVTR